METPESYRTIKSISEGIFKEKGSKFLSFAFPVSNEAEVKMHQAELRKRFFDARHHVYAFRIGADKKFYRCSDDGEPSNSSGPPVLGQIQSFDLTNILLVVVRYFGGTKLGIPGLINAYRTAAADAINNADIVLCIEKSEMEVLFQYPAMGDIMRIVKDCELEILEQNFMTSCQLRLSIPKSNYDYIFNRFTDLRSCTINVL